MVRSPGCTARFYAHAGYKYMHAQVSSRHFKEFLLKYCHPEDKTGKNGLQDTIKKKQKNNNYLFILEKKRVSIMFHRVQGEEIKKRQN